MPRSRAAYGPSASYGSLQEDIHSGLREIQNAPLHPFRFGDEVIRRALPAIPSRRFASTMEEMLAAPPAVETPHPAPVPRLLVELPSWREGFASNLRDLVSLVARVPSRTPFRPSRILARRFRKASASLGGLRSLRRMPPDRVRTAARPQPLCRLAAARRGATGVRTFRRDLLPTVGISAAGRYPQSVERSSAESRSGLFAPADYFRSAGSRQSFADDRHAAEDQTESRSRSAQHRGMVGREETAARNLRASAHARGRDLAYRAEAGKFRRHSSARRRATYESPKPASIAELGGPTAA